jgi:hypothetical protein
MTRIRKRLPSPAMLVAIVALLAATAGTSWAAIGLGALSDGAKNKTVGVGKLTYVTTATTGTGAEVDVTARCPNGLRVIGGGIHTTNPSKDEVEDSHPIVGGWSGAVRANETETIFAEAICAKSRVVTGAPVG